MEIKMEKISFDDWLRAVLKRLRVTICPSSPVACKRKDSVPGSSIRGSGCI